MKKKPHEEDFGIQKSPGGKEALASKPSGNNQDQKDANEVQFNTIVEMDPNDLKVSPWNVRQDYKKNIETLEKQILADGKIHEPLLVDENNEIIDGSRRWWIAKKHGLKVPVLHRYYGKGKKANEQRVLDSIRSNETEPNTEREIGLAIDKLLQKGANPNEIAAKLGVSPGQITIWTTSIYDKKKSIRENLAELMYNRFRFPEKRKINKIRKYKHIRPTEFLRQLEIYRSLPKLWRDDIVRSIDRGEYVDLEFRLYLSKQKTVRRIIPIRTKKEQEIANKFNERSKKMEMDPLKLTNKLIEMFVLGEIDITQEEYEKFVRSLKEDANN